MVVILINHTTCVPSKDFQISEQSSSSFLTTLSSEFPGACMRSRVTWPLASFKWAQPSARWRGGTVTWSWCGQYWGGYEWIPAPVFGQTARSKHIWRVRTAARFSAISSYRAALEREERSCVKPQGEALDDRRERARPGDVGTLGNLWPAAPPVIDGTIVILGKELDLLPLQATFH